MHQVVVAWEREPKFVALKIFNILWSSMCVCVEQKKVGVHERTQRSGGVVCRSRHDEHQHTYDGVLCRRCERAGLHPSTHDCQWCGRQREAQYAEQNKKVRQDVHATRMRERDTKKKSIDLLIHRLYIIDQNTFIRQILIICNSHNMQIEKKKEYVCIIWEGCVNENCRSPYGL